MESTLQDELRRAGTACRQCGGVSTRLTPKGRLSKICSDACEASRARDQTNASAVRAGTRRAKPFPARACEHCLVHFTPLRADHVACSRKCRVRVAKGYVGPQERDCARCGARFTTKGTQSTTQIYCRKTCTVLAWRAANPEAYAESAKRSAERERAKTADQEANRPPIPCRVCTRPFKGLPWQRICSKACETALAREKARKYDEAQRASHQATFTAECSECGEPFTYESQSGPQYRKFCSRACTDRPSKRKRAARLRRKAPGVDHADKAVSYAWVRKRDGWKCQCCGIPTPRGAVGTPDAPELDHIVPLARGGFHQAGNLWLLCRTCNLIKSDRDPIEFLVSYFAGRPDQLVAAFARVGHVFSHMEV